MQNFKDLYLELAELLTAKIPAVNWIDLWNNQVDFLEDEHPFPSPALFLSFRFINTEDKGKLVQDIRLQVDVYTFYETFADTYKGSYNQQSALAFLDILNNVYAALHGTNGTNYSTMRRIGFNAVDTGNAGNLYLTSFDCLITDYAAVKNYVDGEIDDLVIENVKAPEQEDDSEALFTL